jgi:endonuclease YncB( thermonuclease family)
MVIPLKWKHRKHYAQVRLYGIDAPETEKYSHKTGRISKSGQPYGEEAYKALESKILRAPLPPPANLHGILEN